MAITAETFELTHFEKLERGVSVAKEAYGLLLADLDAEHDKSYELRRQVTSLEEAAAQTAFIEKQLTALIDLVQDVERNVRTHTELFDYARSIA